MIILPGSSVTQYITAIELDGEPINATFVDLEIGRVQYWHKGEQVEGNGKVKVLIESKDKKIALDPVLAVELDRLLEEAKQSMALMEPDAREATYKELKTRLELNS